MQKTTVIISTVGIQLLWPLRLFKRHSFHYANFIKDSQFNFSSTEWQYFGLKPEEKERKRKSVFLDHSSPQQKREEKSGNWKPPPPKLPPAVHWDLLSRCYSEDTLTFLPNVPPERIMRACWCSVFTNFPIPYSGTRSAVAEGHSSLTRDVFVEGYARLLVAKWQLFHYGRINGYSSRELWKTLDGRGMWENVTTMDCLL